MLENINKNPLFKGVSRPKSWIGADYYHVVFQTLLVAIVFVAVATPLALLIVFPLHAIGVALFRYDPYFYQVIRVVGPTRIKTRISAKSWGGAISFSHATTRWAKKNNKM